MKSCAAAVAAFLVCASAAEAAPPLEAYGRLPTLSDVTLSPDGTTIAFVKGDETHRLLVIETIGEHQPSAMMNLGAQKLRDLQWADDSNLIITTSTTTLPAGLIGRREEFATAQVFNIKNKSLHRLIDETKVYGSGSGEITEKVDAMNVVAGLPKPRVVDARASVFVPGIYFPGRQSELGLFRVDLATADGRVVSRYGRSHAEDWVIDGSGNIVAEAEYFESEQRWKLQLFRDGDPGNVIDVAAPIEGPDVEGLSEDGSAVLIGLPRTEDWHTYQQISLRDGSSGPWQHSDLHLGDLMQDPKTDRVIGGPRTSDKDDYVFFDPHADLVWRSVKAAFKDATNVRLVSWSDDWTKVIALAFGPNYGDVYYYVDMKTHKADPIGNEYDGIEDVSPEKWIEYRAADGRVIHAYLTLPMNREAKSLPLIVLPHGGPHARDEPGFDWISQAIASRGYAVLQPEFRGSEGFGRDLLWAGFGEFGHKMQTDLSDGVRALASQGLVDPKRVCIVGGSYGGYAALAGATLDTGVYRCAVSIAGLSDLREQLSLLHWPHNTLDDRGERFWDRFLGVTDLNDPKLDAISPIKHVDKVSIPILLIHGKDDTVVPFSQSENMADALKAAGKQIEFVQLDGEDHWLSRSETRLQMLKATVNFLETNNPPDPAEASASPASSK